MKPIAIAVGDPCGVGPELLRKIVSKYPKLNAGIICPPACAKSLGLSNKLPRLNSWPEEPHKPFLFWQDEDIKSIQSESERRGFVVIALKTITALTLENKAAAIVTGPASKSLLKVENKQYPGQTELIAELCNSDDFVMAFWVKNLLVALLTTHAPIKDVPAMISRNLIVNKTKIVNDSLRQLFKIRRPKIAICGLNPHAGENGLLGTEEISTFAPAIERLKKIGLDVHGPISADTAFYRALNGEFDAIVACYHDQALAAVKALDFLGAVHITLGLPIIRTSPVHGTAYNIVGKNVASEKSFLNAIKLAQRLAKNLK